MLALSDAVMVTSTFLCVPFVKVSHSRVLVLQGADGEGQMLNKGWIRYYWTGAILQHALQTLFLGLAIRWTFHRCVQSLSQRRRVTDEEMVDNGRGSSRDL